MIQKPEPRHTAQLNQPGDIHPPEASRYHSGEMPSSPSSLLGRHSVSYVQMSASRTILILQTKSRLAGRAGQSACRAIAGQQWGQDMTPRVEVQGPRGHSVALPCGCHYLPCLHALMSPHCPTLQTFPSLAQTIRALPLGCT